MKTSFLLKPILFLLFSWLFIPGAGAHESTSYGISFADSYTAADADLACNPPTWLNTYNVTQTSATLEWSDVYNANSYDLQWRIAGQSWSIFGGGPWYNNWLYIGGLQPGTTYEWRIRSNCDNYQSSDWSYTASFTTLYGSSCSTPTWPTTSNITQYSAELSWDPVSGAWDYQVQYRLPGGSWYNVPGSPTNSTWINLSGLNPGTTYEWRVRAVCSYGQYSNWTYPTQFTTLGGYSCDPPGWLFTNNITQNSANLDWDPVNGATGYSIQYRVSGYGSWINVPGGPFSATWYTLTGLTPGTTYEWRVKAHCGYNNYSAWSYIATFTTLGYSCGTPTWPNTYNITSYSATFSWSPVSGATSYTVQYRLPNGYWYEVPGSPVYGTSITLSNLNPSTTYEWRVKANCGYNNYSSWTWPISFTTLGEPTCYAPGWLYTNNITQTSATLDWDPVNGASSYTVQYRTPGGYWYEVPGSPFTATWATLSGLTPGTTYEWRVRANCGYGMYSNWSYIATFTTLGASCSTPTWPNTYNITQTTAQVSWSAVYGAQSYTVQVRPINGNWWDLPGGPVYGTSATITGLYPNTTYEWRVRANCGYSNYSPWTWPISFTTLGEPNCYAPTWLGTNNITSTSATLDWNEVSGAWSYSLQYRVWGGNWQNVPGGPYMQTWFNLYNLQPNTTYEWRVRSNCGNSYYSPWSYPETFTTLGYSCSTPTWPNTYNITQSSATFSWSPVSGAQSYSVEYRLPNGSWWSVPGSPTPNTSITLSGLTPGTTYEWRVRANCGYNSSSSWIWPITFTTLGNACGVPTWPNTYNITQSSATVSWSAVYGATNYSVQYRLPNGSWITPQGSPTSNTSLTISGLSPGTTYEWRVRANCGYSNYSDWTWPVTFTTQGSSCSTPQWPYTYGITATTATFGWTAVYGAQSYTVQLRYPNGNWWDLPGGPVYSNSATATGLTPGTTYEWRVRANCGYNQYSPWTYPVAFTTSGYSGGNDECSNAIWLTVHPYCSNTPGSNVNATPSVPAPVGGCSPSSYKDVWFKFTMPGGWNPEVTIRTTSGSLTDAVMEVYQGDNCGNLYYITCEDDNINGNGSMMPVINLSGYANQTIWVRIWGYWGSTGSFNICVFEGFSYNFTIPEVDDVVPDLGASEDPVIALQKIDPDLQIKQLLQVAPNPTRDILRITLPQTETSRVTQVLLTNMSGLVVMRKVYVPSELPTFEEELDLSDITPGMYMLRVITTSAIFTEKIMVIKD